MMPDAGHGGLLHLHLVPLALHSSSIPTVLCSYLHSLSPVSPIPFSNGCHYCSMNAESGPLAMETAKKGKQQDRVVRPAVYEVCSSTS